MILRIMGSSPNFVLAALQSEKRFCAWLPISIGDSYNSFYMILALWTIYL